MVISIVMKLDWHRLHQSRLQNMLQSFQWLQLVFELWQPHICKFEPKLWINGLFCLFSSVNQTYLEKPLFSKMAKSPISWGISCIRIANTVVNPSLKEFKKLEATANPWIKLSMLLAKRFRYPTIFLESCSEDEVCANKFSMNKKAIIPIIIQSPDVMWSDSEKCIIVGLV